MFSKSCWEGKRVLVVDDSAGSRTLMAELLRSLPIHLRLARDAEQFLELTSRDSFDLLLLDLRLADRDGIELLRAFRESCQQTTVVLITGQASLSSATEALAEGADGYMEKSHLKQGPAAFHLALEKAMLQRERYLAQRDLMLFKEEFQAVMAHDLRGPAASASVALRMYQESARPEVLKIAIRSLDRLFHRLDRYLDFTRMENLAWKMHPQPCDLLELLEEAVTQLRPLLEEKGQSLRWSPKVASVPAEVDPDWMLQAIENLLVNAVKYTQAEGELRLSLRSDSSEWLLEVSDNGPGIPLHQQSQLFQRHGRVRWNGPERGFGLGLLITKNVVEAHGGEICLESTGVAGQGATFRIRLPGRPDRP